MIVKYMQERKAKLCNIVHMSQVSMYTGIMQHVRYMSATEYNNKDERKIVYIFVWVFHLI